ncbi:MAG: phage minor head protein [Actinoallomurus sp.]
MAISQETLRLVEEMRAAVDALADGTVRSLTAAWVRAWDALVWEVADAVQDLAQSGHDGRWPSRAQVLRNERAARALAVVRQALERLAVEANVGISRASADAADIAVQRMSRIIASQFPAEAGDQAALGVRFGTVPADQISAIVKRTTQQVTKLTWPLTRSATEAMKTQLIRGVALGDNPREAARLLMKRLEGEFNGGLARALNVARTEILDAHRAAAAASQEENSDTLAGWVWTAKLDARTCPSCWAQHGQLHPLEEAGPLDHQSGRCARTPKTKTWRELGFDVPEPPDVLQDAEKVFAALPEAEQVAVMGAARLAALQRGDISWADLSKLRRTDGWRDSYGVTPLKDLAA